MERKSIFLSTEKQLKIYVDPMRQRVLREMYIIGEPVTAKKLADKMKITPSSAKHHITQLETLGVVALHHTEQIRGITAKYYGVLPVDIKIGMDTAEYQAERQLIVDNLHMTAYNGLLQNLKDVEKKPHHMREMFVGVVHLTEEQAKEVYDIVQKFTQNNEVAREGTVPFEYSLMFYTVEGKNEI